ncbi:isoaspartyl peptidase/L-asparaginase [Verminephrobacter aporrectodeae subsp. tuberculatae]|uniref:isoaspartyl peptidase/L-asparaginase family protein n=1 Tax=Verminephrobacter aporrectodeae TaxID=1110389 RepID=UPI0022390D6F|nr:isoaspartyl peptidase/L-asparaginase [Verminephrobacter aporrectodeae]MCW5223558.1 isoaspartyl peptidase/L-asparaginase [Verminephrobacter aporrectodeae subsp. tuberculatae]MCW5289024.1 isoaspartyl peptidase/L-asparaginase [Verminephrobacter aporrectodeae subsp. tuberculatae]MCW8197301.1 isoaspartyl peptidase/L-asparaginase [Verminephrobacter aporrectodeae subsp. tuberculatae]MCW8207391.1 isoaspartyl peptidase/L-asparaginase [Verminephrobacter aporrectodeae subsp. tuberculatae]
MVAIHGGAGTISRTRMTQQGEQAHAQALRDILLATQDVLHAGGSALDAVTLAVRLLEDCELFNAGRGSVFTRDQTHEMDAAVMEGTGLRAGAVACVKRVRNPVLSARLVMERSEHVLLVGEGADAFAQVHGMAMVPASYFSTPERLRQLQRAKESGGAQLLLDHDGASLADGAQQAPAGAPLDGDTKHGTVGAVACDAQGHVAAATSTGGLTNKIPGRVGDTPLIGAGCYADDATCAVSCTGIGEAFMKAVAAYDVAALMAYGGLSLDHAATRVVQHRLGRFHGRGGLIAVNAHGEVVMPFNTEGMYRGHARVGAEPVVGIYA